MINIRLPILENRGDYITALSGSLRIGWVQKVEPHIMADPALFKIPMCHVPVLKENLLIHNYVL